MNIGRTIYWFCNGYFGRDDYDDKIIILEGEKWIVCRYVDRDEVACTHFRSEEEKNRLINDWAKDSRDDDY